MNIIIGSQALATGAVTRYQLTAEYQRVLPDVYAPKRMRWTLNDRILAAWLWSHREAVVTDLSAAALHGSLWVDATVPVELNLPHNKSPHGIITRRDTLLENEVQRCREMAVTSVERTALDLARRGEVGDAIARLDALARVTHFKPDDVLAVAAQHQGMRGIGRLAEVLDLVDAGAQSPKETWLRLLLIAAGFPRPQTQIPVLGPDGCPLYFLDLGWEEFMVAVEYDGEQHRTDAAQYRGDVKRAEYIVDRGWRRFVVLAGDREAAVVQRVEDAGVPRDPGRRIRVLEE